VFKKTQMEAAVPLPGWQQRAASIRAHLAQLPTVNSTTAAMAAAYEDLGCIDQTR
jgi:hypothetical protein